MTVVAGAALSAVAIGASAGGLSALQVVLGALTPDLTAAVVVVLHLHPHFPSLLPRVLSRDVRLDVRAAAEGALLERGTVYLAVPNLHLVTPERRAHLLDSPLEHFSRPSINCLFESVAMAWGPRSIGVILTGSGSDGAAGLTAIKRAGGVTIVQDPREALFDAMPRAALSTGCVDHILPLADIGPAIMRAAAALDTLTTA
jgi:two-component system chemotaxis response regulator CheB